MIWVPRAGSELSRAFKGLMQVHAGSVSPLLMPFAQAFQAASAGL